MNFGSIKAMISAQMKHNNNPVKQMFIGIPGKQMFIYLPDWSGCVCAGRFGVIECDFGIINSNQALFIKPFAAPCFVVYGFRGNQRLITAADVHYKSSDDASEAGDLVFNLDAEFH